ncbi:hypothetical protein PVAR5_8247 [Paecilomyces variotii No. 5]|uniref:Uncharacterized protein n=1 Tax=Byssochlamys spectabilis (strain No. 5 / NBRC 109023) TaxID=1356009 RepID=V5GF03_BYSSN|nr:hypothetical protein PVAR5_8247 [Paecilomyces variotii No. 5]
MEHYHYVPTLISWTSRQARRFTGLPIKTTCAITDQGKPRKQYDMQIWKDLPCLAWDFREEWDDLSIPSGPPDQRQKAISSVINLNRFTALLMATEEPVFDYHFFALIAFSDALEIPPEELLDKCLDSVVPAAAAWIEILGEEIYEWDDAMNTRGPLWIGQRRFCEERWSFWHKRFMELAHMDEGIGEAARTAARKAAEIMEDIQNWDVEE